MLFAVVTVSMHDHLLCVTGIPQRSSVSSCADSCDMFRWDINKALPAAAMLARPSMDLQQTSSVKQQTDGHIFVASSSAQARARQNLDKGD